MLPFESSFLYRLSVFLRTNIGDYLTPEQPHMDITQMHYIHKMAQKISLFGNLEKRGRSWLLRKTEELQTHIHELTL